MQKVPKRELRGTHFEQGKALGRIYADPVQKGFWGFKPKVEAVIVDKKKLDMQVSIFKEFFPGYLEFIEGISDGANVNKDKLAYHMIAKYAGSGGCSIFGVKTKNGVLVARNLDWIAQTAKIFETYSCIFPTDAKRNSFVSVSDMDLGEDVKQSLVYHCTIDVINKKGLYTGITFSFYEGKNGYGIPASIMSQLIAETCATTEEALELFRGVPVANTKNFFIADKQGDMAVVEHIGGGSTQFKVVNPDEHGILGKTNHMLDTSLKTGDLVPVGHSTYNRYDTAKEMLESQRNVITLDAMREIFSNPPLFVGMDKKYPTIWTLLMDMGAQEYQLNYGGARHRTEELKIQ